MNVTLTNSIIYPGLSKIGLYTDCHTDINFSITSSEPRYMVAYFEVFDGKQWLHVQNNFPTLQITHAQNQRTQAIYHKKTSITCLKIFCNPTEEIRVRLNIKTDKYILGRFSFFIKSGNGVAKVRPKILVGIINGENAEYFARTFYYYLLSFGGPLGTPTNWDEVCKKINTIGDKSSTDSENYTRTPEERKEKYNSINNNHHFDLLFDCIQPQTHHTIAIPL